MNLDNPDNSIEYSIPISIDPNLLDMVTPEVTQTISDTMALYFSDGMVELMTGIDAFNAIHPELVLSLTLNIDAADTQNESSPHV